MTSRNFDDFIRRDTEREIAHHERTVAKKQPPPHKPPAPLPTAHFLSQVPDKPLTWLWPGRIPQCMDYPHQGSSKLLMISSTRWQVIQWRMKTSSILSATDPIEKRIECLLPASLG